MEAYGADRVLEPVGALPQAALRLDASLPMQPYEMEVAVDTLCLDSTSFRQLVDANDADPSRVASSILEIVGHRGKMDNPVTGSGGILTGTVRAVGSRYRDPPNIGERVVPLSSLTLTPLSLEAVLGVDPTTSHVPVRGTAYLAWPIPWARFPEDLDFRIALAALDVGNAPVQTRALITPDTATVLVLGGGHAGVLAMAAARESLAPGGRIVLIDSSSRVCERAQRLGLCDVAVSSDLRDAQGSRRAIESLGVEPADLTVVVVNASECEAAALMLTSNEGTVLFFSMATTFAKAALGSECVSSNARMVIGSGYAHDRGEYALRLVRENESVREAFEER